jgi:hypothetical protein
LTMISELFKSLVSISSSDFEMYFFLLTSHWRPDYFRDRKSLLL